MLRPDQTDHKKETSPQAGKARRGAGATERAAALYLIDLARRDRTEREPGEKEAYE